MTQCFVLRLLYCRERIQKLPCFQLTERDQGIPPKKQSEQKVRSVQAHRGCCTQGHIWELTQACREAAPSPQGLWTESSFPPWVSVLKSMLNTNTIGTQTAEEDVLVSPPFTCQIHSKSFNCEVTKQRPFALFCSHEHPKSHIIF